MKITEDTPQRLVIKSRRKILPDIVFLFFLTVGSLIAASMTQADMRDALNVFALFLGLFFAGIGVWGLLENASDHAVLEATTRTLTVKRRRLLGSDALEVPFSDVEDISVHEDDDMHTVSFSVKDRDDILLETTFSRNLEAAALAERLREWFGARATM